MSSSTYVVTTTLSFETALAASNAGDTILLAPGVYNDVIIKGITHYAPITIASEDPSHPAVLTSLLISGSNRIALNDLELDSSSATTAYPFRIQNSKAIQMSELNVHGSMDGNPQNDVPELLVSGSRSVSIVNSEFQQAALGISFKSSLYLTISGNSFHDIVSDGIHGVGSSYVTVANNYFYTFDPVGTPSTGGTHPDAIQFWASHNTAHDIAITGNIIEQADGLPFQGIFMNTGVDKAPFQNVTIDDNTIVGGLCNGIRVIGADGLTVSNNLVEGLTTQTQNPWIWIANASQVTLTHNAAMAFDLLNVSGLTASHDIASTRVTPDVQLSSTDTVLNPSYHTLFLTGFQDISAQGNSLGDTIVANSGADNITGGAGADTFIAGTGNDTFTGGGGADTFVFSSHTGQDVVTDLASSGGTGSVLDLSAYLSAGQAPTLQDTGAGAVIHLFNGGSITLLGVQAADLAPSSTGYVYS